MDGLLDDELASELEEWDEVAELEKEKELEPQQLEAESKRPLTVADRPSPAAATTVKPSLLFTDTVSLLAQVEAVLFATPQPIKAQEVWELLELEGLTLQQTTALCEQLVRSYQERAGGFTLVHTKGLGYQFQTIPAVAHLMEKMFSQRPRPLSRAAHETLAIIAYRQPVSRADIEFIRGVDAGSIIKNLLDRDLIRCVGRREDSPGKPMLFGTTEAFLQVYKMANITDLPPLEAFQPSAATLQQAKKELNPEAPDPEAEALLPLPSHDKDKLASQTRLATRQASL